MPSSDQLELEYREMYRSFLLALKMQLQALSVSKIVVIGFGYGAELPVLLRWAPESQIVAVEEDWKAITSFQAALNGQERQNLKFIHADCQDKSVLSQLVDAELIVSFFVRHLINERSREANTWFDLVQPGSALVTADWCSPTACALDIRWQVTHSEYFKFREVNPSRIMTTGALLRIARKI